MRNLDFKWRTDVLQLVMRSMPAVDPILCIGKFELEFGFNSAIVTYVRANEID